MSEHELITASNAEADEMVEPIRYHFDLTRRSFVQLLGAGILVSVSGGEVFGQRRRGGGESGPATVEARLHIGEDGTITVLTGKVDVGQGSRTEISQAAAEELHVALDQIRLVMADTEVTPNDGGTAGSRTTPSTIPNVRKGAAYARELLVGLAAQQLQVPKESLTVENGVVKQSGSDKKVTFAELAKSPDLGNLLKQTVPGEVQVSAVNDWKILGKSAPKVTAREIVTGAHKYPSDIARPGMLYGKVLRAPAYKATLKAIDLAPTQAMSGVVVVRDGEFVGFAAATSYQAAKALESAAKTAQWESAPHPSSKELFAYLRAHAGQRDGRGGGDGEVEKALASAAKSVTASYEIAYIQHVPMEPRAAVAEWAGDHVTIWTGTQQPLGVHGQVAQAFSIPQNQVRIVVPDTGGGFGGKHSGEVAIEAARLAKAAGKPVSLRWTREEEFMWAYFRPAGIVDLKGGLDAKGKLTAFEHINYNSGGAGVGCPYRVDPKVTQTIACEGPLREGSYRALAATGNNFARESFIDELAAAAGVDPLEFRLAHLDEARLINVLNAAAKTFGWAPRARPQKPESKTGFGLACGTEKGSYVAACAEVEVDRAAGTIRVVRVCEAFECGAALNPDNLRGQIQGAIIMGLGGALTEAIEFENGKLLNGTLRKYRVPRFHDVPPIEIVVLDRPDLPSVGAGETPIVAIAPAIANAVFDATGVRIRSMPIRGETLKT